MHRIVAVCIAAALAPALAGAAEMKPKFGDIDGVYYTDVAGDREACHQAVRNKIALCRENTSFVSNTEDRKYPGCLPIFEEQAMSCVDHFRSEAYKCDGAGSARIEDFTGFSCTVTETVLEEDDQTDTVEEEDQADTVEVPNAPENAADASEEEDRRNEAALAAAWRKCEAIGTRWDSLNEERWACVDRETVDSRGEAMRKCAAQYEQTMRSTLQEGLNSCCGPVPGSSSADHRDINCDYWKHIETLWNR